MFKFHQHNFIEIERFYAEPAKGFISQFSTNYDDMRTFGQTTILYKCVNRYWEQELEHPEWGKPMYRGGEGCGKTRKETALGKSARS